MNDEMQSLRESDTFTLTNLPEGKKAVEVGGTVEGYALKNNADGSDNTRHNMWPKNTLKRWMQTIRKPVLLLLT